MDASDEPSESDYSNTPEELAEIDQNVSLNLLPHKSKEKYERKYQLFSSWREGKKVTKLSEKCSNSLYF